MQAQRTREGMTQVTDRDVSGLPPKGLAASRCHHFRGKKQGCQFEQSGWHPPHPEAQDAQLCQWAKGRAALGISGRGIGEASAEALAWLGRQQPTSLRDWKSVPCARLIPSAQTLGSAGSWLGAYLGTSQEVPSHRLSPEGLAGVAREFRGPGGC